MRLSPLEAYDTVMRFARDCGEWPLRLAMHASVAQSFRPVFLHLMKLNYLPEAVGDPSVESDVLLAPFCQEIGAGYYHFDPRVRALLLDNLQSEYAAEGRSRLRSVAAFLMNYLNAQEQSIDSTQDRLSQTCIEVQRWVALSILDPDGAAHQLAAALNRTGRSGDAVARVQIGGLVNVLAAPLLRYPQLTDYALGVQALERGEVERAQDLLSGLGELQVGPVKLRPARAVLAAWNVREKAAAAETSSVEEQPRYASCFISWARGGETRQFVDHVARDLRYEGVDCQVDGEDLSAPLSPLAGRQVLVLVISARAESTYELSQHADEAARAGMPIITLSLDRPWDVPFRGTFDAVGDVDFSDGRTPDQSGYRIALNQLMELLRDHVGWQPEAPQNPWSGRKFEYEVFLSYNEADTQQNWVDRFHNDLEARLQMIRGTRPKIWTNPTVWRDTRISPGDSWPEMLDKNFPDSAIFVPVVTPDYLESDRCRYELFNFISGAEQSGGLVFQGHSRICPVLLGPIESRDLPDPLGLVQGIKFPDPRRAGVTQDYLAKVDQLAYALRDTLELFQPAPPKDAVPQVKTVYLAYTASDVEPVWEEVRRELQSHGYHVLPEGPDPHAVEDRKADLEPPVKADLERSALSIHLLGDRYRPLGVLQLDVAREFVNRGLSSLVWLKRGAVEDPRQREWIRSIEHGDYPAEILRTSVGELKTHILDTLNRLDDRTRRSAAGRQIYLQVGRSDREAASPLAHYLRKQGFSVSLPVFDGPPTAMRDAHHEMLLACEASILYWGSVPQEWVKARLEDTLKFCAMKQYRPLMGVYVGPPSDSAKQSYAGFAGLQLLRSLTTVDPAALDPLIRELRPGTNVT